MAKGVSTTAGRGARANRNARPSVVWRSLLLGIVLLLVLVLSPGTILILGVGMLPTAVAIVVDRSAGKHAAAAVGGMNFAGVFPFLFRMWMYGDNLSTAALVLTDPLSLVTMYLAAAAGWGLCAGGPPAMCALRRVSAMNTVRKLRAHQKSLAEQWGEEVAGGSR